MDLAHVRPENLSRLSDEQFAEVMALVLRDHEQDKQENALLYFEPSQPAARQVIASRALRIGVGGGNRSSKTETCMAKWVALATGVIPKSCWDDLRPQFRGPRRVRMVVESLTVTLAPIILPKLQWWQWSGLAPQGGPRGHWGWIPKMCLIDGEWSKSWTEKTRILKIHCLNPDNHDERLGFSTIQFMSFDQDSTDFASGDFDIVHEDEPPPHAVHRENEARVMSVGGMMLLSMTWPDDPAIPVDWIYDEIYDPGQPGPNKDPDKEWFELDSLQNPHLDQESMRKQAASWDEMTRKVRIKGQPLRFSNRIHPLFTDRDEWWSFAAGKVIEPQNGMCPETGSYDVARFNHVETFEHSKIWPVVFLLDPHPRKPHMMLWAQITPSDDIDVIDYLHLDKDPVDVKLAVEQVERELGLNVVSRIGDPNMLRSPASAKRNVTWKDEFADAGLAVEEADDSDVGRARLNEYLKPDPYTKRPRIRFHSRCAAANQPGVETPVFQIKRFVWSDWRRKDEKDVKNVPRPKYDDFPALLRYLLNTNPDFRFLSAGAPIIRAGRPTRR